MKKMAHEIVSSRYSDELMNGPGNTCSNQLEQYERVKNNVNAILCDSAFMNGGCDEQVLNQSFMCIF
jgi:hypothetical protein